MTNLTKPSKDSIMTSKQTSKQEVKMDKFEALTKELKELVTLLKGKPIGWYPDFDEYWTHGIECGQGKAADQIVELLAKHGIEVKIKPTAPKPSEKAMERIRTEFKDRVANQPKPTKPVDMTMDLKPEYTRKIVPQNISPIAPAPVPVRPQPAPKKVEPVVEIPKKAEALDLFDLGLDKDSILAKFKKKKMKKPEKAAKTKTKKNKTVKARGPRGPYKTKKKAAKGMK